MKAIACTVLGVFAALFIAVAVVGTKEFASQRRAEHGEARSSASGVSNRSASRNIDKFLEWKIERATSYQSFHKDVETGTYSDRYAIEAWLYPDGRHICSELAIYSSPAYCLTPDSLLPIENVFAGERARSFYDLRGRRGCFLISTNVGALLVEDFAAGSCTMTEGEAASFQPSE